jgi:glycerol-3-phosphate acyltransferase PlsY
MEIFRLTLAIVVASLIAYLFGSINFAIIFTKLFIKKDIREYGSGNAGMTNVLRTVGKGAAVLTTLGDFCKGVLAVLLGHLVLHYLGGSDVFFADYFIAVSALLGHCFPLYYNFKGGKGILVSAGIIAVLNPWVFLIILTTFLITVIVSRIVSLASIAAAVMFPIATLVLGLIQHEVTVWYDTLSAVLIAGIVIFMHRGNIKRLKNGTEHKFGQKKEKPSAKPDA